MSDDCGMVLTAVFVLAFFYLMVAEPFKVLMRSVDRDDLSRIADALERIAPQKTDKVLNRTKKYPMNRRRK